jgi:hypothetical protein
MNSVFPPSPLFTPGPEFALDYLTGKCHSEIPLYKLDDSPKTRENIAINKLIRSCVNDDIVERRKLPDFKRAIQTLFKLEKFLFSIKLKNTFKFTCNLT